MRRFTIIVVTIIGVLGMIQQRQDGRTRLPAPARDGEMSLEAALAARRSVRQFAQTRLTPKQIAQLCWAAQGITEPQRGLRTAPSAGALYPIELYVVTAAGVDHYEPDGHVLRRRLKDDVRRALQRAALNQEAIGEAPVSVVITAVAQRTERKYGRRAERYCFLEAGHVAQNILLQATALRLAAVPIGAFDDRDVAGVLQLPDDHRPLYIVSVGHPRTASD
jgi:SagB-type dehydrogenase family enzyme